MMMMMMMQQVRQWRYHVDDVNDHTPHFVKSLYRSTMSETTSTTMSESLEKGSSVTSVSATDNDVGVNARVTYTLAERDREYFYITTVDATNTGVIKVFKVSNGHIVSLFRNLRSIHTPTSEW